MKTNLVILLVVVVLIGIGSGAYLYTQKPATLEEANEAEEISDGLVDSGGSRLILLDDEAVRQIVIAKWGDCADKCQNFSISVNHDADIPYVAATYDGMYDDSVKTEIISAQVIYNSEINQYVIDDTSISKGWVCWPGRGHQEFSQELCF